MKESPDVETAKEVINIILGMNKSDLRLLRNSLVHQKINLYRERGFEISLKSVDKEKQELIGILPYVLLDKKYFPSLIELVKFARKNLGIKIRFPHSKSRDAIIGSIIAEVAKKEAIQISILADALRRIIGKESKEEIKDFFTEWDKIIRET